MITILPKKPFLLNLFPKEKSMLEYISQHTQKNKTEALKHMIHAQYFTIKKQTNKPISIETIAFTSNAVSPDTLFERNDVYEDRLSMYQ